MVQDGVRPIQWLRSIARDAPCSTCGRPPGEHQAQEHPYCHPAAQGEAGLAATLAVAAVVMTYANGDSGRLFVRISDLQQRTGLAERSIRRALAALQSAGYLERTRTGAGRGGRASAYQLRSPEIPARADHYSRAIPEPHDQYSPGNSGHSRQEYRPPATEIPANRAAPRSKKEFKGAPAAPSPECNICSKPKHHHGRSRALDDHAYQPRQIGQAS